MIDVLAGAEGRSQCRGACLWGEDINGVVHVRRVPPLELVLAPRRAKQARGALDVAVCSAPPGGAEGGKGSIQGSLEGIKLKGTSENLPIIHKPFVADALVLEGVGEELVPAPAQAHSG